jgi:hypothetical protein
MAAAAVIIAHQVAAKATREALFFSSFPATSLPKMTIGAALFSLAIVILTSRLLAARGPAKVVPGAFWVSGLLHLLEWALLPRYERAVAVGFYLHFAALGAALISGFWLTVNERWDPYSAKKRMRQIVGAGTIGALIGGVLVERVGAVRSVGTILPALAAMHVFCGCILLILQRPAPAGASALSPGHTRSAGGVGAGVRLLAALPYLRHLALLVFLSTAGGVMIDYVFKAQAQAASGHAQAALQRFYAWFYTGVSLASFCVNAALTRLLLKKSGLSATVSSLPATVLSGSLGSILWPGLASATIARGSEYTIRNSLFRSSYELFYTPVLPAEKRSAKLLIDVGFERLGDILGSALVACYLWLTPGMAHPAVLGTAAVSGLLGFWVARRLDRGYVGALEKSLRTRAVELDMGEVEDKTTCATLIRVFQDVEARPHAAPEPGEEAAHVPLDPVVRRIRELRSGDSSRVRNALEEDALTPALAAHAIPLLAWDEVSGRAAESLRSIAASIAGQLVDAMLDPGQEFSVRRRIPAVLAAAPSGRAAEGLLLGLEDRRFEVRYRCGRALAAIVEKNPDLAPPADRLYAVVSRELEAGRLLWESHRLLDGFEESEVLEGRASHGLRHVFVLLSIILPRQPLRIAYRALQTEDELLRGTALEYLASVLPARIQERLWPLLEERPPAERRKRSREAILEELLKSNQSIELKLAELRGKKTVREG